MAHALTLTYTAPLFIAALSFLVLKEPLPRRTLPAALAALVGVAVLAGFEPRLDRRMLVGDVLAVGAAITFAVYSLLGRRERARLPLLTYAAGVYLVAGLVTSPFAGSLLRPGLPLGALGSRVRHGAGPVRPRSHPVQCLHSAAAPEYPESYRHSRGDAGHSVGVDGARGAASPGTRLPARRSPSWASSLVLR